MSATTSASSRRGQISEQVLIGVSILLALVCLALALSIIRARYFTDEALPMQMPRSPATSFAWVGQVPSGLEIALLFEEIDPAIREARDRSLEALFDTTPDSCSFADVFFFGARGDDAAPISLPSTLEFELEIEKEVRKGRVLGERIGADRSRLSSGATLLLGQRELKGEVAPQKARRVLLEIPGPVEMAEIGRVQALVDGVSVDCQKIAFKPGELDATLSSRRTDPGR